MSLSFEESLKNNALTATLKTMNVAEVAMENDIAIANDGIMTLEENYGIAAYSGDDGNWQQHSGYVYYSTFSDDNISIINE